MFKSNHLIGFGGGVSDAGPQVIAPSSNDWDSGSGSFNAFGNPLGNHSVGGGIQGNTTNEGWRTLVTVDGDFIIDFVLAETQTAGFGIYDLTEDATFDETERRGGLHLMTDSFWWGYDYTQTVVWHGGTSEGSFTAPLDGENLILRRVAGVLTLENVTQATTLRQWTGTSTAPMRFVYCASTDTNGKITDLFITDTDKIQRDGFFNEGAAAAMVCGTQEYCGSRIVATRSGTVSTVKFSVASVTTGFDAHVDIYRGDGTDPVTKLGTSSDTVSMGSTGTKTFTFASLDAVVKKGEYIWAIIRNEDSPTGSITMDCINTFGESRTGLGSSPTSLSDETREYKMEIEIDTSAGEPTPGHDTILLVSGEGVNDATAIPDLSQNGFVETVVGDCHLDDAQNLGFGTTAINFDGTGDKITFPDNDKFHPPGDFTFESIIRTTSLAAEQHIMAKGSSNGAWSIIEWWIKLNTSGYVVFQMGNNGGTGFTLTGTTAVVVNTDTHIAVVRLGDRFDIYTAGVSNANTTSSATMTKNGTVFTIGDHTGTSIPFVGWQKRVRLLNYAAWNADFTPPTVAYS